MLATCDLGLVCDQCVWSRERLDRPALEIPLMSMDSKPPVTSPPTSAAIRHREKGIRIFMWPKMIYIFPSAIVALICSIGMWSLREKHYDPAKRSRASRAPARARRNRPTPAPADDQAGAVPASSEPAGRALHGRPGVQPAGDGTRFPPVRAGRRDPADPLRPLLRALAGGLLPARPDEADPRACSSRSTSSPTRAST